MDPGEPRVPDTSDLGELLGELRQAGQTPDQTLLERIKQHGQAAVRPLLELAVDEELNNAESDRPEVWAPLHAIQLLGDLGAAEAVEPLLPFFDWVEDDYLAETLPGAFGGIGAPAVLPLRGLLFDRSHDVWARVRVADSLGEIAKRHPATRFDVVSALVARLDPAESQVPEDEIVNGAVISQLLELKAVEAAPMILQAFEEDRVDTSIVDVDGAIEKLDLSPDSRPIPSAKPDGLRLRLRCTACRFEREHHVETVFCDLPTQERRQRGESPPYSEFVIPQRITCPKCGVVDQYELSGMAMLTLTAEMLKMAAAQKLSKPGAEPEEGALQFIRFGLADGREMHPHEARELYRRKVEADPDLPDLRVRYANVIRFLNYRREAIDQYREALRLEPANLEASLNLGRLAKEAGDRVEARKWFDNLIAQAPRSGLPLRDRALYVEAALEDLSELTELSERLVGARLGPRAALGGRGLVSPSPRPLPQSARKVGRNEPCPCGSGKKYKKCHGR